MAGIVTPYSYDYFPSWNVGDGITWQEFGKLLLDDYLFEYRKRILG
jgi:hypothetical protein